MASSFPFSLDLNLALPTQVWGARGCTIVDALLCFLMRTSYRKRHFLLLENDVAVRVARSLVTPRDVHVLGMRDDNRVVSDVMALSVQSAASIASVGHRLIVKSHEVEVLKAQLVAERNLVEDCQCVIRSLKRERENTVEANRHQLEILHEENQKLSKIVDFYSQDMQKQLEALDQPGKRKH
ncbi:unnamed protein product [Prunus brigantina]